MAGVLVATLICSDPVCAEEHEAVVGREPLDGLMCDCGCALLAVAFYELTPARAAPTSA